MKLTGEERVRVLLAMVPYMQERRYRGNYDDIDELSDILDAYERADLTERQREVINLVFIEDLTHIEASRRLGISRKVVTVHADKAVKIITEEYEREQRRE